MTTEMMKKLVEEMIDEVIKNGFSKFSTTLSFGLGREATEEEDIEFYDFCNNYLNECDEREIVVDTKNYYDSQEDIYGYVPCAVFCSVTEEGIEFDEYGLNKFLND